jgi:diguanylate cyclase (GGDEF)-like protein/PAS domain S-box-containing protein
MPDPPPRRVSLSAADYEQLCTISGGLITVTGGDGILLHVNDVWEQTLGWTPEEMVGRSFEDLVHPDDLDATRAVFVDARETGVQDFESRARARDGSWRSLRWRAEFRNGRWYGVAQDVTRSRQLEFDVLRDPLTGILNRAACLDRLAHALARATRCGRPIAVLFIDLDGFKAVNDSLGHAIGDSVLASVARRLDAAVRRSDSVARLGGDEFVVLAEDVPDAETVEMLSERISGALREPFPVPEGVVKLGASIGIVVAERGSAAELLRQADVAMYRAKLTGRDRAVWFDETLRAEVEARLLLAGELRGATARGELRVHYQPIVTVSDDTVVGCEALVRWQHPRHGLLTPNAFLGIAEDEGNIADVGAWVLEQACRQQRAWRRDGNDLSVSVNVSARELSDPAYVDRVSRILQTTGVHAVSLTLEVTETALLRETEGAARVLAALKRLGIRIALDDFGRGYSSLEHLKFLPVDVIKIDRGFVAGIDVSEDDRAIVAAVAALARTTGRAVIAEGVETDAQLRELRELGCEFAQGFTFGRPSPASDLVLDGFIPHGRPGIGDPFVIREFMRQIGVPARLR